MVNFSEKCIFLLSYLLWLLKWRRTKDLHKNRLTIKNILIIHLGHLGEVTLSTGAISILRNQFPNANITCVVGSWALPIIKHSNLVDKLITYDAPMYSRNKRKGGKSFRNTIKKFSQNGFDLICDFRKDFSALRYEAFSTARYMLDFGVARLAKRENSTHFMRDHYFQRYLSTIKLGNLTNDLATTQISLPTENELEIDRILSGINLLGKKFVIFHPFATEESREWPLEKYADLAHQIYLQLELPVLIAVPPHERKRSERLANLILTPCFTIDRALTPAQLAGLCKKADLFVCSDGGGMHLASTTDVTVLALFGAKPRHWELFGPWSKSGIVIDSGTGVYNISPEDVLRTIIYNIGLDPDENNFLTRFEHLPFAVYEVK